MSSLLQRHYGQRIFIRKYIFSQNVLSLAHNRRFLWYFRLFHKISTQLVKYYMKKTAENINTEACSRDLDSHMTFGSRGRATM